MSFADWINITQIVFDHSSTCVKLLNSFLWLMGLDKKSFCVNVTSLLLLLTNSPILMSHSIVTVSTSILVRCFLSVDFFVHASSFQWVFSKTYPFMITVLTSKFTYLLLHMKYALNWGTMGISVAHSVTKHFESQSIPGAIFSHFISRKPVQ